MGFERRPASIVLAVALLPGCGGRPERVDPTNDAGHDASTRAWLRPAASPLVRRRPLPIADRAPREASSDAEPEPDAAPDAEPDAEPEPDAPAALWSSPALPAFDAATVAHVADVLALGVSLGRRADVFAKAGDSITASRSPRSSTRSRPPTCCSDTAPTICTR